MKTQSPHLTERDVAAHLSEHDIESLYRSLLNAWDRRDARAFATLFVEDGHVIGYDGSLMEGRAEIEPELERIFAQHPTPTYVCKVRDVRVLGPDVGILFAIAGMVPAGENELDPAVNALHTMVAARGGRRLEIVSFQSTPAALHGRPEMANQVTEELRAALSARPS